MTGGERMIRSEEARDLLKAFRRIAQALDLQSRRIARAVGLTLPQLVVLTCVRDLGEVTSRAISQAADLSPATVVGILDKLEAKGLIERYRSSTDRRIVHTRLTEAGLAALRDAPPLLGEAFEDAFAGLPAARRQRLVEEVALAASLALEPRAFLPVEPE